MFFVRICREAITKIMAVESVFDSRNYRNYDTKTCNHHENIHPECPQRILFEDHYHFLNISILLITQKDWNRSEFHKHSQPHILFPPFRAHAAIFATKERNRLSRVCSPAQFIRFALAPSRAYKKVVIAALRHHLFIPPQREEQSVLSSDRSSVLVLNLSNRLKPSRKGTFFNFKLCDCSSKVWIKLAVRIIRLPKG